MAKLIAPHGGGKLVNLLVRPEAREARRAQGALFSIPVTLPVDAKAPVTLDAEIALRDGRNDLLAIMRVEEIWEWDRDAVASQAFGTLDPRHPLVAEMRSWGPLNVSGALEVLAL